MSDAFDGTNPNGVGASPLRKEDARHLAGRGLFVSDIPPGNVWEAAIVRSPVAHGYLKGIDTSAVPAGIKVLSAADFPDIGAIR
ncbi:MAG: carbon-monoxide dehydrogenase large subunit, partial [Alphaproteobacteria bacterium]